MRDNLWEYCPYRFWLWRVTCTELVSVMCSLVQLTGIAQMVTLHVEFIHICTETYFCGVLNKPYSLNV